MSTCCAIVVNWNSGPDLARCLESILGQSTCFEQVLVVDNNSRDGSIHAAREKGIEVVSLHENAGFARAVNIGAQRAETDLLALLNPDVVLDRCWLENMKCALAEEGMAAMCSGRVLFADKDDLVENTGHLLFPDGLNRARSRMQENGPEIDALPPPLFPSGCAAVYSRSAFLEAGGLCEDMFAYGEDADLGLRLRMKGYTCAWAPDAVAWHKLSGSTGRWSYQKGYLVERNRIWVLFRCYPLAAVAVSPVFTLARHLLQGAAVYSGKGAPGGFVKAGGSKTHLLKALARAYCDALYALPARLAERRRIRAGRSVPDLEFYGWLFVHRARLFDIGLGE